MRNKKFIMIAILFVSLLAISAVSAAEDNTTDEVAIAEDNLIIEETSDDAISDSQENVIGAKDDGTFTALQNKINNAKDGSKITLENDYTYKESDYTIKINKSVTINGNNHVIKGSQSRIIAVDGSYWDSDLGFVSLNITVKMENIRFNQGGINLEEGSNLILENCSFTNHEISYDGGAIYSEGNLVVQDSSFTNNKADDGGAIYSEGNLVVQDSFFTNNVADYRGAAIYSQGNLLVENCVFNENHAYYSGGAIYAKCFYDTGERIIWSRNPIEFEVYLFSPIIKESTFTDNLAGGMLHEEGAGGAIYSQGYKDVADNYVDVVKSTFSGNKAEYVPNLVDEWEYINDDISGRFIATDCIFISNNLTVDDVTKYYGDNKKLVVNLEDSKGNAIEDAEVNIVINGKTSTVTTDYNGQASMSLNLGVGTYDVVSDYEGVETTSKVTVKSTIAASDASGTYSNSKVSAKFLNTNGKVLASKQVTFKIGSKTYTATTNNKGVATADVDLDAGTYTVTAVNPVNKEQRTFKLTISKANSKVALTSSQNMHVITLTAALTPATATGKLVFDVSGKTYNATISNGKAVLKLDDLKAGDYVATAVYNGNKNLKTSTSNNVTFTIAKVYPILTAKDVTKTYGNANKLIVYLKDSRGNPIAKTEVNVKINKYVTTITTNANGQASMAINLAPGTYYAKISYTGDKQISTKIVVKKATPKLTAKAKTFKKSVKTKKYTVTLKTNKNKALKKVKLSLKVKGKTYYATTNKYGKATFKITKLTKKGIYPATLKFKGSKYYNAKTVKPKIKIK